MKTGYQIYIKGFKKDGSGISKKFRNGGLLNWFWNEEDAIARKKALEDTWSKYGVQYKIVFLG